MTHTYYCSIIQKCPCPKNSLCSIPLSPSLLENTDLFTVSIVLPFLKCSFSVDSFGFSTYILISCTNSDNHLSVSNCYSSNFFLLSKLASICSTIGNNSGNSEISYLFIYLFFFKWENLLYTSEQDFGIRHIHTNVYILSVYNVRK